MRSARFIPLIILGLAGGAAVPPAVAAKPAHTPPRVRLPTMVKPVRYAARLTVRPTEPTFTGAIDIDVTVDKATDIVWLDSTALKVTRAAMKLGNATIAARTVAGGEDFIGLTID